ncbi:MAG: hypothetical protein NVS1B11_30630 [Terriglobales bacterium]
MVNKFYSARAFDQHRDIFRSHVCFALIVLASLFIFWIPIKKLIDFSLTHDYGSHILLVFPTSVFLVHVKRNQIFSKSAPNFYAALALILAGILAIWPERINSLASSEYLWIPILALMFFWVAGFICCYGMRAFWEARFPFGFLVLLLPLPPKLVDVTIFTLQEGSAAVTYWLFETLGIPVFRDGFVFHIHTLQIEIAKECSGIRSSIALLITALLVGEFVLRGVWRKSLLVLSILPIVVLKNGLRIVTLSLLTIYVNPGFLHGRLHHSGGIVFYLLGLLGVGGVTFLLKKSEGSEPRRSCEDHGAQSDPKETKMAERPSTG